MSRTIILDSGPLGKIAHPKPNKDIVEWLNQRLTAGDEIVIPAIADYEVRRGLLLENLNQSVKRLDQLEAKLTFLPLSVAALFKAAELWADIRRAGFPTADPHALDGDVILAAQALEIGAIVATENSSHLTRLVDAKDWRNII